MEATFIEYLTAIRETGALGVLALAVYLLFRDWHRRGKGDE